MDNKLIKEATHCIEVWSDIWKKQAQTGIIRIEDLDSQLKLSERLQSTYTVCVWLIKPKKVG